MAAQFLVLTTILWLAHLNVLLAAVEASEPRDKGDVLSQGTNVEGIAVEPPDESTREVMELHQVTHVDELAVCNDGSPGAYYHRPGTSASSTRWVIRFLGGAWCWDGPSCAARNTSTPYLMSTSALPPRTSARTHARGLPDIVLQSHGVTSVDADKNPSFASWNHVHVWYCSSDSHLGDAFPGRKNEFAGRQFRGRRIAAAVMMDLLTWRGLSAATHVLLTGDSAGGVGIMNLADRIASTLREEAPGLESVKLLVDAGWFLDIPPYANRSDGMTFNKCAKTLAASFGAVYDGSCEQSFPVGESWRCFFAHDCQAHLDTPALFHEYLYDSANMGYDGVSSSAEAENFRSRTEASLKLSEASSAWNDSCDNATDVTAPLSGSGAVSLGHQLVSGKSSREVPNLDASRSFYIKRIQNKMPGFAVLQITESTRWERVAQAFALTEMPGQAMGPASSMSQQRTKDFIAEEQPSTTANECKVHSMPNIFAPACQLHEMIDSVLFTMSHVGNARFVDVLDAWFGGHLSNVHVIDTHPGMRGGSECGFDPASAQQLAAVVTTGV